MENTQGITKYLLNATPQLSNTLLRSFYSKRVIVKRMIDFSEVGLYILFTIAVKTSRTFKLNTNVLRIFTKKGKLYMQLILRGHKTAVKQFYITQQ